MVNGQVSVSGTATHPDFWKYEIRVAPGQNPNIRDDQWYRVIVREEPVVNGQLAVWNTTVLPDGVYTLRLRVVRQDGNWQDFDVLPLNVSNTVPPTATPVPEVPTATWTATPVPELTEPTPDLSTPTPDLSTPTSTPTPTPTPTPTILATLTPFQEQAERSATLTALPSLGSNALEPSATASPIIIDQPTIIIPVGTGADSEEADEDDVEIALGSQEDGSAPNPLTADSALPSLPDNLGSGLDASTLVSACFTGAAFTIGLFFLVGVLYLLRSLVAMFR
ncbi:MAG: hypothetical protein M3220_20880 [Chloroflexota bacterium]|nr:hypothetical protein [Chloroflexota bacterium]